MWSACRLPLQCSPSPSPAIRLNSLQYSELRDKLQAPIRTARNFVIQQSLSDRFAAAFLDQVRRNGIYSLPPGSPVGSSLALMSSLSLTVNFHSLVLRPCAWAKKSYTHVSTLAEEFALHNNVHVGGGVYLMSFHNNVHVGGST